MSNDLTPGRRVLVVDDNHYAARAVAALLEGCGHATAVAYGAQDALMLADQFQPDVIFLDIDMPDMERFRSGTAQRSLQTGGQARIFAVGFDAHLAQPASFKALLNFTM